MFSDRLLGKKALLKQAMTKVGDLEKGLTNGMDKDELLGIVHQLDKDLTGVNNLIDEAVRKIDRYHGSTQRQTNWLPEFIATAYAQDGFAVPGNIKLMFAAAALVVIVSLVAYCLWLIARPIPDDLKKPDRTAVIADKKWAKELLNKQIVFLGGLIAGIVLR